MNIYLKAIKAIPQLLRTTLLDQNLNIRKRIATIEGELFFHYNQTQT